MKALLVICILVVAGYCAKTPYSALIEHPSINKIKARSWGKILISYAELKSADPQFKRLFDFLDKFEVVANEYKEEEIKKYAEETNAHETLIAALSDELTGATNNKFTSQGIVDADQIKLEETKTKIAELIAQIDAKEQELVDATNNRIAENQLYIETVERYNDVIAACGEVVDLLAQMKVPDEFTFAQIASKSQPLIKVLEKGINHLQFKGSKKAEYMLLIATIKKLVQEPDQKKGNKYLGQVIDLINAYKEDVIANIERLDQIEEFQVKQFEEYKANTQSIIDSLKADKENNLTIKSNLEAEIQTNQEIVIREDEHIISLNESISLENISFDTITQNHNLLIENMDGDLAMIAEARQILAEANITPY